MTNAPTGRPFPTLPRPHCRCGRRMDPAGPADIFMCGECDRGWSRKPPPPEAPVPAPNAPPKPAAPTPAETPQETP